MGNAILTNLNGMTNPPSDLNEIDSGWKFFKHNITNGSKAISIANGSKLPQTITSQTLIKSNFSFSASGIALMIVSENQSDSSASLTANLSKIIKPWPSNPTSTNILDTTGFPLTIIYDGSLTRTIICGGAAIYSDLDYQDCGPVITMVPSYTISLTSKYIMITFTASITGRLTYEKANGGLASRQMTESPADISAAVYSSSLSCYGWYLPG